MWYVVAAYAGDRSVSSSSTVAAVLVSSCGSWNRILLNAYFVFRCLFVKKEKRTKYGEQYVNK